MDEKKQNKLKGKKKQVQPPDPCSDEYVCKLFSKAHKYQQGNDRKKGRKKVRKFTIEKLYASKVLLDDFVEESSSEDDSDLLGGSKDEQYSQIEEEQEGIEQLES